MKGVVKKYPRPGRGAPWQSLFRRIQYRQVEENLSAEGLYTGRLCTVAEEIRFITCILLDPYVDLRI